MTGYIINPSWFYWISVADEMKFALGLVAILALISAIILIAVGFCAEEELFKHWRISLVIAFIFGVASIFIPSKDALISMQIARFATYENAEWTLDSLKAAVDYIVNAIAAINMK